MMRFLLLLVGLACLLPAASAFGDSFRYEFPRLLNLTLEKMASPESGVQAVAIRLESRLGTLKDLQLFATCSPDLAIDGLASSVNPLDEGQPFVCTFSARLSGGKPDELGTWVRLGVTYVPDYDRLIQAVSNVASFPDHPERQRMIDIARKNSLSKKPYTDATRLFLESR